jgi:hypothetical protein
LIGREHCKVKYLSGGAYIDFCLDGENKVTLFEWALKRKILTLQENCYSIDPRVINEYNREDTQISTPYIRNVEDLADLVNFINHQLRNGDAYLILLSECYSKKSFLNSIAANLRDWLFGTYNESLDDLLTSLKRSLLSSPDGLDIAQDKLTAAKNKTSGLTQLIQDALDKKQLYGSREVKYNEIKEALNYLSERDRRVRMWKDIRKELETLVGQEDKSYENREIPFILDIAAQVNDVLQKLLELANNRSNQEEHRSDFISSLENLKTKVESCNSATILAMKFSPNSNSSNSERIEYRTFISSRLLLILEAKDFSDFRKFFDDLYPVLLGIQELGRTLLRQYSLDESVRGKTLQVEYKYFIRWDKIRSTDCDATELSLRLRLAYGKIENLLGEQKDFDRAALNDSTAGMDDSNQLTCDSFYDVMAIFDILSQAFIDEGTGFRIGCSYYKESSKEEGFQLATRVMDFYKHVSEETYSNCPPPECPNGSYLLLPRDAYTKGVEKAGYDLNLVGFTSQEFPGHYDPKLDNIKINDIRLILITKTQS